ncbi:MULTISPECIES: hypothetical protein [unclassified Ruegeria]|uniref:hypothetical protein n=1 Tax=unclassified Ruegeria TaxID=2625375 RepID=UPI00148859B4|nr:MULTISPECIES: hypothetical protein [unclassified Ruegeria]
MTDKLREALNQIEQLRDQVDPNDKAPIISGRDVTDSDVDQEMVRRGWARFLGGFGDRRVVGPVDRDTYWQRRDQVRAELKAKAGASKAGNERWREELEALHDAIKQAAVEYGRPLRSKANGSRVLKDRVNTILEGQGIKPRSARTLEDHIPSAFL